MSTTRNAGFATVTSIGPDVIDGLLAAASASVAMPSFSLPSVITLGSDEIGLSGSLSLLAPTVAFSANPANLIAVTFGGSGTLTLTDNGGSLIEVEVTLQTTLDLAFTVKITPASLSIGLDAATAVLASVSVAVDFGPPLVPVYQNALTGGMVLAAFTKAIQSVPESALTFTVPGASGTFDLSYGELGVSLSISNVVVVPLDGVLDIGVDVAGLTAGDASQLVNLITTPSPTPIYYLEGTDHIAGGTFGSHSTEQIGDGYIYDINFAVAVNTDFLAAAFSGPLSNELANTLISVSASNISASYDISASDTVETIAKALFEGLQTIETGQELADVGITLSRSGAVINISGPPSILPPAPYATRTDHVKKLTYVATGFITPGPTGTHTSLTVVGVPPAGQTLTATIPAGGIKIESVGLQAEGMYAQLPNCSPDLPTTIPYGCLTLTLNGQLLAFYNPGPGEWAVGNEASFTFSISFTPIQETTSTGTQWNFPCANFTISSPLLSFIDFLPLGLPIFAGAINGAVSSIISNGLAAGGLFNLGTGGVNGSSPFPGNPKWNINYAIWGLVVCPTVPDADAVGAELDTYASVRVTGPPAAAPTTSQFSLAADDSHTLINLLPIFVQLKVTNGAALFNPLLGVRIRWTAKRNDTGAQTFSQDTLFASTELAVNIPRADGSNLIYNDTWSVTCTVYRPADAIVPEFAYFSQTIQVGQVDVVDRNHPYVRWSHTIGIHDPAGPPPLKSHTLWFRQCNSRIHRTDLLIRCSMLDRAIDRHPDLYLSYVDSLASIGTLQELTHPHVVNRHNQRKELCDYCFFGGPTKNAWKTPTAPTPDWE